MTFPGPDQDPGSFQPFAPPDPAAPTAVPGYQQGYPEGYPVAAQPAYQTPAGYPAVPAYQDPAYPPAAGQRNGLGTTALVLGIASIPTACCFGFGGLFGIAALVFGAVGVRRASQDRADRGLAVAGLVCGGLGVLFSVAFWSLFTMGSAPSNLFG